MSRATMGKDQSVAFKTDAFDCSFHISLSNEFLGDFLFLLLIISKTYPISVNVLMSSETKFQLDPSFFCRIQLKFRFWLHIKR